MRNSLKIVAALAASVLLGLLLVNLAAGLEVKQSTSVTLALGPFLDANGVPQTGLVLRANDVKLSKNGGAFAAKNDATDLAHLEAGVYSCVLNATDTGTLGILTMVVVDPNIVPTGAVDPNAWWAAPALEVTSAGYWNWKYGTAALDVNAVAIRQELDANSTQLAAIVADTNELQTDWTDAGRLDTLLDNLITWTTDLLKRVKRLGLGSEY